MQPIRAIAFDLYGTLYDVHAVARACEAAFPGQGGAIARLWRQKTLEYTWLRGLTERYTDFENVTEDSLRFCCAQFRLPLDAGTTRALCDAYLALAPFADTPPALRTLKDAGLALAIVSNGSHRSIGQVVNHSGLRWAFDHLISVQDVEVFKPHRKVYVLAEERIGLAREQILFVSANAWDASAASHFGFPVCWINRHGGPFDELGAQPDLIVPDLQDMAAWVVRQAAR